MDFLLKTNKGIESIITRFSDNNSNITLYPMVHFGIKEFYQQISSQAKNHEIVLYEGLSINPESENFYSSILEYDLNGKNISLNEIFFMTISLYQSTVSRIFGLCEQSLEQFDYIRLKNFHNADFCVDDAEEKSYESNNKNKSHVDIWYDKKNNKNFNKKINNDKILKNYIGNLLYRIDLLTFMDRKRSKKSSQYMLEVYDSIINEALSDSKIIKKMVLSRQRELQLINMLEVVLEKYTDIGIIYGAAHMDFFSKYLRKNGYYVSYKDDIVVIPNMPPRFSGKNG